MLRTGSVIVNDCSGCAAICGMIGGMSQQEPSPRSANNPIVEQKIFDGSPAFVGRLGAFLVSWVIALVLVIVPVILVSQSDFPWWATAGCIVLAILVLLVQPIYQRSIRYRVTNYRIDFERGIVTRQIDSLELWHAHDLLFRQSLLERMLGVGTITVLSDDESNPRVILRSIANGREVFEQIKSAILNAKRHRGILELDK